MRSVMTTPCTGYVPGDGEDDEEGERGGELRDDVLGGLIELGLQRVRGTVVEDDILQYREFNTKQGNQNYFKYHCRLYLHLFYDP